MPADAVAIVRDAIRAWPSRELAAFAEARHGYGNSDGGCGITYSEDLDDYDRTIDGIQIPGGFVRAYVNWGAESTNIPEWLYLNILAEELDLAGLPDDAARVRALAQR